MAGDLLLQALSMMGAALIAVPLFKWLGFGSVLGYLIAGIVIGPFGLSLIHEAKEVAHFSELGVVFLLFIIGLEIQPQKLWRMRRHLFGLGGAQIVLSTFIFGSAALAFGIEGRLALVIGLALSLSSTAFAIQSLIERGHFQNEFGRASFATLLMQDLVAIPALSIVPWLLRDGVQGSAYSSLDLGRDIAIILTVFLAGRYFTRPVFRLVASTRSRETFTVTALFIVLGVAAITTQLGVSAALGTFLAGVLLAGSEYRHELETNIEPFKGLLMGMFFMAVGMGVDLSLVMRAPITLAALTLAYVTLKILVIYGAGRLFKMSNPNSRLMAIYISQGGEFAFVLFGIVASLKPQAQETLGFLTALITASMILTPIILWFEERLSIWRAAEAKREFDKIENESPQVLLAGYGRFGQMFGRVLTAQEIPYVAIDNDPEQIELVRRFGTKVYYGDATREDLLESAGAANAKAIVLALDDTEKSIELVKLVKSKFSHLKIFARARNRGHAFELLDLGVENFKREVFDSSVSLVGELLLELGYSQESANRLISRFKSHDEIMLREQAKVRTDNKTLVSVSKQGTAQLAEVLREDRLQSRINS